MLALAQVQESCAPMDTKREILFLAKDDIVVQYNTDTGNCKVLCKDRSFDAKPQLLNPESLKVFTAYLQQEVEKGTVLGCSLDVESGANVLSIYKNYDGLRLNKVSLPLGPAGSVDHWATLRLALKFSEQNWDLAHYYKTQNEQHKQLAQELVEAKAEHDKSIYARVATILSARENKQPDLSEEQLDTEIKSE